MLIGPNSASAFATTLLASLNLVTSQTTKPACGPIPAAASRSTAARRPARTTLAPADAMHRAIARPSPVPPPVIRATSPSRRKGGSPLEIIADDPAGLILRVLIPYP